MRDRVLVVEDDLQTLDLLVDVLQQEGFEVTKAESLAKSIAEIQKSPPNVISADYQLRDGTAFDLLAWLTEHDIHIPLIVLTGQASIDLAVQAVKNGAEHFVTKPVDIGLLITHLRRSLENSRVHQKDLVKRLEAARHEHDPFLGESNAILECKKAAMRLSEGVRSVLIQGETGTGKGVMARWLHRTGERSKEAFVDVNCVGLSRELLESELFGYQRGAFTGAVGNKLGFVEAANHGTLFLDEIGDMDPFVQSKILKVVEERHFHRLGDVYERKVDVQIISATHHDLKKLSEEGKFRTDLYFRISALPLHIPPLRDRVEDIPAIAAKLLEQLSGELRCGQLRVADDALHKLQKYSWPGNIRELRNVLERAAILSNEEVIRGIDLDLDTIDCQCHPARLPLAALTLKEMESEYIRQVLEAKDGNVMQACVQLGIPRSSLYAKIREHNIQKNTSPKLLELS